jgi:hypothetical protein
MMSSKVHAYRQAPWRIVVRSTSWTLLWVMILLILGGLYLTINAKAANSGRKVMMLTAEYEAKLAEYNELASLHAEDTSPQRMQARAEALGFRPATPDDTVYIITKELIPTTNFHAPLPRSGSDPGTRAMSPAFSETLIDRIRIWLGVDEPS